MIDRETIEKKMLESLGEASVLFMTQECKGTEIVMPTEELIKIARNSANQLEMAQAFRILKEHLENDEGYYESWKANVAMAFKDTAPENIGLEFKDIHEWSNEAASMFMERLLM